MTQQQTNMGKYGKYVDKYGDVWDRHSLYYVIRRRDGNIGLWLNGDGLTRG